MGSQLTIIEPNEIEQRQDALTAVGHVANQHAEAAVFAVYLSRKADPTLQTQGAALDAFAQFLQAAGDSAIFITEGIATGPSYLPRLKFTLLFRKETAPSMLFHRFGAVSVVSLLKEN